IANALDYPTRPGHIVVGFPPGGAPDIVARLVGQWLSERLDQQFLIDNRPGAAGNIATEIVAKAQPDGYTRLMALSTTAVNAALYKNLSFNFIRDITTVASIGGTPFVMAVNPSFPAKTMPEFIAYTKANPGKVNMASQGIGTTPHVCGELFKMLTGVDFVHVPYRVNLMPDLLAGQCRRRSSTSKMVVSAPLGSLLRVARKRCRTFLLLANSRPATWQSVGLVSAHLPARRPWSLTNST